MVENPSLGYDAPVLSVRNKGQQASEAGTRRKEMGDKTPKRPPKPKKPKPATQPPTKGA